jgi:hypothetical protein
MEMNKEKLRGILARFSPIIIKVFALIGALAILMAIICGIMPSLFFSHTSNAEPSVSDLRRYRNDLDELTAMFDDSRHRKERSVDMSAEELCNLYPKEDVCVSWREKEKCFNNEKCSEEYAVDDETMEEYEEAVLSCFILNDEMLDDETIDNLPDDCRRFKFFNIEDIWGRNLDKADFRQIQLSGNEDVWAQKITPGHIAGIARGLKLIITDNEKLKEFEDFIPIIEAFESFEEVGPDKEMATGLIIGLYNSVVTGEDIAKKRTVEENNSYCASLKEDIIPVRCRIPQN